VDNSVDRSRCRFVTICKGDSILLKVREKILKSLASQTPLASQRSVFCEWYYIVPLPFVGEQVYPDKVSLPLEHLWKSYR